MGFNQVYQQLRELFPEIDARIVKAVSIENSDDVEAAVSVIIDDVIPSLSVSPSKPLPPTPQMPISRAPPKFLSLASQKSLPPNPQMPVTRAPKHLSNNPQKPSSPTPVKPTSPTQVDVYSTPRQELQISAKTRNEEVGHVDEGFRLKKKQTEEACSSSSTVPVSSLTNMGNNASHSYDSGNIYSRRQIEKALNDPLILESSRPFTVHGSSPSVVPVSSPIILGSSFNHPYLKAQIKEVQALNYLESSSSFTSHSSESIADLESSSSFTSHFSKIDAASSVGGTEDVDEDSGMKFFEVSSTSPLTQENNANDQVCTISNNKELVLHNTQEISDKPEDQCGPVNLKGQREGEDTVFNNGQPMAATSLPEDQCNLVISKDDLDTEEEKVPVASVGLQLKIDSSAEFSEEPNELLDKQIRQTDSVSEAFDADDVSGLDTLVTHSGQICRVELLKDMIEDARSNKKTLFASMKSVIGIMNEVNEKEKAAEIAKEEAARGGVDIIGKVEDLKKVVQRAKEANEMHAGEVNGEKGILATEARELQSRLFSLSDERDKSLAILDEMHQALEARLAAAEDEIRKAEAEKSVKEESARSALAEQKAIMDKVVQEAKFLQEVAEENSKLQEFLMESGHTLDILQGEISVICHDVRSLKQRFDDRLPLSESVSSSQTSCKLASSGSSRRSLESVEVPVEGYESQKETSPADSFHVESPKMSDEEKKSGNHSRELVDDGWELFENDA